MKKYESRRAVTPTPVKVGEGQMVNIKGRTYEYREIETIDFEEIPEAEYNLKPVNRAAMILVVGVVVYMLWKLILAAFLLVIFCLWLSLVTVWALKFANRPRPRKNRIKTGPKWQNNFHQKAETIINNFYQN